MLVELFRRLLRLLFPSRQPSARPQNATTDGTTRTIVPLLIYPVLEGEDRLDEKLEVDGDTYYTSSPWELPLVKVEGSVREAEAWMAQALDVMVPWERVRVVRSRRTLAEWRSRKIGLVREEVEELALPWTDQRVYVAMTRGMGGYAGGIAYGNGSAGQAMVGDICLEALCGFPEPNSGSALLGENGWPPGSYGAAGQLGSLIHETLHGLDLPHPDGWGRAEQPGWEETIMGHWWKFPSFRDTPGLTRREVARVRKWMG